NEYDHVRTSNVETLLIGGALDFATPPQIATKELLPYLPNGHQVVLAGLGHTTSFWTEQPQASSHLINAFFDSGRVDVSLYKPMSVDFAPEVTQTALAKGIAGGMVGFGLLTILSLLWMARRVHTRGRFGRQAGATRRSAEISPCSGSTSHGIGRFVSASPRAPERRWRRVPRLLEPAPRLSIGQVLWAFTFAGLDVSTALRNRGTRPAASYLSRRPSHRLVRAPFRPGSDDRRRAGS